MWGKRKLYTVSAALVADLIIATNVINSKQIDKKSNLLRWKKRKFSKQPY